ncbi:MAG: mitochondrial fission ELM1 family protein [Rhodospirillaceae bacterium]|nr:mitochondrial fission ELM1 family protein [Rhodospirillaceae bacterium]
MTSPTCWVLTEGHAGMDNQALGMAEALGLAATRKAIKARKPWRNLPPRLWLGWRGLDGLAGDPLAPPWPDVTVGCGKQAALAAWLIRRASGGRTFTIHVQTPPLPAKGFDVLVVPRHDGVTGPNVVVTEGAVHRVTRAQLEAAARHFAPRYAALPSPRVAVLIGGSNNRYRLTPQRMQVLADQLATLAKGGAGLMVTPSRRTEPEAAHILERALAGLSADIWDGSGENPYFGLLALADAVLVTRDSVSMVSEAVFAGKPVHVIDLEGRSRRIELFHAHMEKQGYTRRFAGTLERWAFTPPDDTAMAAARIKPLLEARIAGATLRLSP